MATIDEQTWQVYFAACEHLERGHAPCPDDIRRSTGIQIDKVFDALRDLYRLRLVKIAKADGMAIVVSTDKSREYWVRVAPSTGPLAAAARFSHMALVPMEGVE